MFWPIKRQPKRHRLRIYPEERERIVALLLEKRNSALVARLVGRSRTPIARIVKEEAIELWGDCVWYEEEEKIISLLKKGLTGAEVAKRSGRSKMTISNIAKAHGIALPKGRRKSK